jgi:hypothetical protein
LALPFGTLGATVADEEEDPPALGSGKEEYRFK